jgi:hypothetical protein
MFDNNMLVNNINKFENKINRTNINDGFIRSNDNLRDNCNLKKSKPKRQNSTKSSNIHSDILKKDNMVSNKNLFKFYNDIIPFTENINEDMFTENHFKDPERDDFKP